MSTTTDDIMANLVADPDCPEGVANMLAEQEDNTEHLPKFLALLCARLPNYPKRFNRLTLAHNRYGEWFYVITNYDYKTYKWAKSLDIPKEYQKITPNKIYLRCAGLPLKILKALEAKLDEEKN